MEGRNVCLAGSGIDSSESQAAFEAGFDKIPLNDTEAKWRVYNALLADHPLTPRQLKNRVFQQCGMILDVHTILPELQVEGFARHHNLSDEWSRAENPDEDRFGQETLWEQEFEDETALAVTVTYPLLGKPEVVVSSFPDEPVVGEFGLQYWKREGVNQIPERLLPPDGEKILRQALQHYEVGE